MKVFKTKQIAEIDQFTIEHEPVSHVDLMERAATVIDNFLLNQFRAWGEVLIFCGPGNNGGDGLALARLLAGHGLRFQVSVYLCCFGRALSPSSEINLTRLTKQGLANIEYIETFDQIPPLPASALIIDALFGSGLTRPLNGLAAEIVKAINQAGGNVVSIDMPSGLFGEDNTENHHDYIIKATQTLSLQFPKISFFMPENEAYVGQWYVLGIGLHPTAIEQTITPYHFVDASDINQIIKPRARFSHKGHFGHALLIAGSYGKMGAAILAAKACLRSGVGLLTVHSPHKTSNMVQTALPEAMASIDDSDLMFTSVNDLETYSAIGIGPALGFKVNTQRGFKTLIDTAKNPMVIDADGINILAKNTEWIKLLSENTVITPHPGEFDRLAGKSENGWHRLQKARQLAIDNHLIVVLKGAFTATINPLGEVFFNSTGNPGMATAGSGDTLTGVILGLLAQGYNSFDAAVTAVFFHGMAGDMAAANHGESGLIASDIVDNIGKAFCKFSCVDRKNLTDEGFFPSLYGVGKTECCTE